MTGQHCGYVQDGRFGRLTFKQKLGTDALVQCDCGNTRVTQIRAVVNGTTRSCGCLHRESLVTRNFKHGMSGTPTYNIWAGMIMRCTNPHHKDFQWYGARGITVIKRWQEFKNFFADMGERPPGLTLDRKNNDRGYSKGNCRWATLEEQANNKRNNKSKK